MTTRSWRSAVRETAAVARLELLLAFVCLPALGAADAPCDGWEFVATPNVGNSVTQLTAVTALSADDAWSVGLWRDQPAGRGPLVMHWNGSVWSLVDLPETSQLGSYPETAGVGAAPNGDVWVAGNVTAPYPANNLPLVLRWRAGTWDFVEAVTLRPQTEYPYGARGGFADEVAALAPDDVWVAGQAAGFGDAGATSVPLAMHWDGSTWTDVDVPRVANRHHDLRGLVAIATDDVWAVGDYRNLALAYHGVTYHWNGSSWSHVVSPIEQLPESGLEDVAATGPNDVWALGNAQDVGPVLMHWDGFQWSLAPAPPNSGGSLAAVGPNDLWVSGWNGFWHWDGATWTEVSASVPGSTYVIRNGGMAIVGDCDLWCAGFWTLADGITSSTLAERLQPVSTSVPGDAAASRLRLAFPNPFPRGSTIHFAAPGAQPVTLALYDVNGRQVRSLLADGGGQGDRSLSWHGEDDAGASLPRGVYLLMLDAGNAKRIEKLVLLGAEQ